MKRKTNTYGIASLILACALMIPSTILEAQGPRTSYFFHSSTEVPWAECVLYQGGGSSQKIPFLPVVATGPFRAPLGTANLTRDVVVDGPLVFLGNGIVHEDDWNSYVGRREDRSLGEIDVSGKIVLFSHDAPDAIQEEFGRAVPLSQRIREAEGRGAAAVVLFSMRQDHPFLALQFRTEAEVPRIPVITVTRQSALDIFAASGVFDERVLEEWEETKAPPQSSDLITGMRIRFDGAFERIETENFDLRYPPGAYGRQEMHRISELNEESLVFLEEALQDEDTVIWEKLPTVLFPGFDIKLFYTRHWGRGAASPEGVFNTFGGEAPDFGLIVHENMHILTRLNWSRNTTSFLAEGIAMYMEALATEEEKNHRRTVTYLEQGHLFPLEEMTTFQIGLAGLKTEVAYPASGSFTAYLIEAYGLQPFKEAYALEGRRPEEREADDTWAKVYGKDLRDLEAEWLSWLAAEYGIDSAFVRRHLETVAEARRVAEVEPGILEEYAGSYNRMSPDLSLEIGREGGKLLVRWGGQVTLSLLPRSETEFFFRLMDGKITFVRDADGAVTHLLLERFGEELKVPREREG